MGSYLDKPETTKKSEIDENDLFKIGSSSMQVRFRGKFHEFRCSNQLFYLLSGMANKSGGN
jgi:hypothetical protein